MTGIVWLKTSEVISAACCQRLAITRSRFVPQVLDVAAPIKDHRSVKGDRVEIVIDAGGETRTYEVGATRAGRRVEITTGRGIVEVSEVTRGGTPVRTARFMASRVLALVEHPAARTRLDDDEAPAEVPRQASRESQEGPTYH